MDTPQYRDDGIRRNGGPADYRDGLVHTMPTIFGARPMPIAEREALMSGGAPHAQQQPQNNDVGSALTGQQPEMQKPTLQPLQMPGEDLYAIVRRLLAEATPPPLLGTPKLPGGM